MNLELIKPDFVDLELSKKIKPLYRLTTKSMRNYIDVIDTKRKKFDIFPSVTTITKRTLPESEGLKALRAEKGKDFNSFMYERAAIGTFVHEQISRYIQTGSFDFDFLEENITFYLHGRKLNFEPFAWLQEIRPMMISFFRFFDEYKVQPIAVELPVKYKHRKIKYAGMIDMIAQVTINEKRAEGDEIKSGKNKGKRKLIDVPVDKIAMIDFKTGTSGFYDEYALQLHLYAKAFKQMTGLEVDLLLNVRPAKFMNGNVPNYAVKDQMNNEVKEKIPAILNLFFQDYQEPKQIPVFSGRVESASDVSNCFSYVPVSEYIFNMSKIKN